MKVFASEIYQAVRTGKLREPFNVKTVKIACPGWADRAYHTFLSKHAVSNGNTTELFLRAARGRYLIISVSGETTQRLQ